MNNLPEFPSFRKITLDDQDWYEHFYKDFDACADFCFHNFIVWLDQRDDLELSRLHGNIIIRFTDTFWLVDKISPTYSIMGNRMIEESLRAIFAHQEEQGVPQAVEMVPEVVIDALTDMTAFNITNDRENAEYILDAEKLAALEGPSLRSFREDCRSFARKHGDKTEIVEFDLTDRDTVHYIINNFHSWEQAFRHNDAERHEAAAINKIFENAESLQYKAFGIRIDGRLEAFTLYHHIPQSEWLMPNSVKVSYRYNDLYDYTVYELAKHAVEYGAKYLNFEQDLGVQGMRQYKESLRPIRLLHKYTIEPNTL